MVPDVSGGIVPTLSGRDLLEHVPALASIAEIDVETSTLVPGASLTDTFPSEMSVLPGNTSVIVRVSPVSVSY